MPDKKAINAHEKKMAKRIGAQQQPASGSLAHRKGDMVIGDFLIDDKHTDGKSISVTKDMIVKINKEARESGREACLSLSFEGMGLAGNTWYCVPEHVFLNRCVDGV